MYSLLFSGVLSVTLSLFLPSSSHCAEIPRLNSYIDNGGYALSNSDGRLLYSKNLQTPFIPASTIKLVTSLAALEILGPTYRFSTTLFLDREANLTIRGSGDPFFVSEKIDAIARLIKEQNITEIQDLVLDDSAYDQVGATEGSANSTNPYDAPATALGVNFNTVPLRILHKAKIQSPEPQTPYLPLMGHIGKVLPSGTHRVNIEAFPPMGELPNTLLYCGQLLTALLQKHGVHVKGTIRHGRVSAETSPLLTYTAQETVRDLVRASLLSSSNFMANQLYLAVGARQYGYPATWDKAQKAVGEFIETKLGLSTSQIRMVEGSGLAPANRVTPEAMLQVLETFRPHSSLLPTKYGVLMKSGTLRKSGVFCYAGYIPVGDSHNPFVIFLNQKKNTRDTILTTLYKNLLNQKSTDN